VDCETDDLDLLTRIATTDSVLELALRVQARRIGLTGWPFFKKLGVANRSEFDAGSFPARFFEHSTGPSVKTAPDSQTIIL
jgi:hypothetical protein